MSFSVLFPYNTHIVPINLSLTTSFIQPTHPYPPTTIATASSIATVMVTLSSHPKQVSLSSTPSTQDVASLPTPLTLSSVHQLWTQALSLTPPSPSLSLTHLKRLLRMLNPLPRPLLTPAQTAPLYLNVALILAYLGEYFLAAESFHKAVKLDGKSAIGWHGYGGMKFLLGDWEKARGAWKTCLACLGTQQSLKYRVWKIGGSGAETEKGKTEKDWVLERARVEWNLKYAVLKDKEEREKLQEKVWGINGIPAGMVFGPSFPAKNDNLHDSKGTKGLKKGHMEGAKANARQHVPTNIPLANTRTLSHATENSTKPLPAIPDDTPSTAIPLPRTQKGISLSRLFTRPRTSSASKTQALKPKRPEFSAAPFTCGDLSVPLPVYEEGYSSAYSVTRAGLMPYSNFQQLEAFDNTAAAIPDFFKNVFDTDSESDPDAEADADELKYYYSTQPEPEVDISHAVTSLAPVISTSLPLILPRTRSYRSGRIQYPLMEMRDEIRQEMRQRDLNSHFGGRKRNAIPTKVEDKEEKKSRTTVENNELKKSAPTSEEGHLNEATTKIKSKESKEEPTKVEDKKSNRTATKAEENKQNGFTRHLQLEHKDTRIDKVELCKDEMRGRSARTNVEAQTAVKGRGAEKKMVLETVLEMSTPAESHETKDYNLVRGRSERRNGENQTGFKGEKNKILEASTFSKSQKVEEKSEVRASSKKRNPKGHGEQEAKALAMITEASQKLEESMPTRRGPAKPEPSKTEPTTQEPELEYLSPVRFEPKFEKKESKSTRKEPEKPEPAKPEPAIQEPELEYLKPVRFEGFNGEWREKDLEYEAEARMEREKLNGGK